MSLFTRRESPPQFDHPTRYREYLRRDFRRRCAYCDRPEAQLGGEEFFEIDHFRPVSKFPELNCHYPNLYYACGRCNRYKGSKWPTDDLRARGFRFADPCEEDMYLVHLGEGEDGRLRALTNSGVYTCDVINL